MTPPIFLDERGDISAFASVEAVRRKVEPIDVLNREFTAYDRAGEVLRLSVVGSIVQLTPHDPPRYDPNQLRNALQAFILAVDEIPATSEELKQVVDAFVEQFGLRT